MQIFPLFSMKICVFTRKFQISGSLILVYQKDFVTLQADFVSPKIKLPKPKKNILRTRCLVNPIHLFPQPLKKVMLR